MTIANTKDAKRSSEIENPSRRIKKGWGEIESLLFFKYNIRQYNKIMG